MPGLEICLGCYAVLVTEAAVGDATGNSCPSKKFGCECRPELRDVYGGGTHAIFRTHIGEYGA